MSESIQLHYGDPNLRIIPRGTQTKTTGSRQKNDATGTSEAASAAEEVAAERDLTFA